MKSKFQPIVLVGLIALLFSSCTSKTEKATPVDMDKLKVEIQAMEDAFAAGEKVRQEVISTFSDTQRMQLKTILAENKPMLLPEKPKRASKLVKIRNKIKALLR